MKSSLMSSTILHYPFITYFDSFPIDEKHQQHLDQLQAMIISNMVNTQYQQTLTTLNYDLLKKEVGE